MHSVCTQTLVMCDYITQEINHQIYTTSGNEARLKVLENTDINYRTFMPRYVH